MKTFEEFSKINENINFTNESTNSLKGVKEYRDGLTPELVLELFPWLLKAKFKDAIIGIRNGRRQGEKIIRWYDGTWENGTWNGGIWEDGTWEDGSWESGIWKSGTWKNGTWKNGTWKNGNFCSGIWENDTWNNGTRLFGSWKSGAWKLGYWCDGEWEEGNWIKGEREKSQSKIEQQRKYREE